MFVSIFTKGDSFYEFLFASSRQKKRVYSYKKDFAPGGANFFLIREDAY